MTKLLRAAFLAALTTAGFAAPPALAASGGSSAPSVDPSFPPPTPAQPRDAGGVTLSTRGGALVGRKVRFVGSVAGGGEGGQVSIERRDPDDGWVRAASAQTDEDGAFAARWKADAAGTFPFRAVVSRNSTQANAATAVGSMTLTVYKSTLASTFFDRETACGKRLRRSTLGVAHKTLPCGTKVAFYYRGRTITVPVVDRGPYRRGYSWDLTEAAAAKLGFEGIGRIGSLVVSKRAPVR